jgi:hypothetical protein
MSLVEELLAGSLTTVLQKVDNGHVTKTSFDDKKPPNMSSYIEGNHTLRHF